VGRAHTSGLAPGVSRAGRLVRGGSVGVEQLELRLEGRAERRRVRAGVGVVVAVVGVGQDRRDGFGVLDHGDQAQPALAPWTDEGVGEGAAQQLGPSDAYVLGELGRGSGSGGLGGVELAATVAAKRGAAARIVVGVCVLG
jgi:hypothetical protein